MSEQDRMLEALLKRLVPLYEHMQVSIEMPGDGVYRARMPFADELRSHVGTVHPAYQWALGELLGGIVALGIFGGVDDIFLVVRRVEIDLLAAANTEITSQTHFSDEQAADVRRELEAEGEVHFELDPITITRADGKEVARLKGRFMVRPRR